MNATKYGYPPGSTCEVRTHRAPDGATCSELFISRPVKNLEYRPARLHAFRWSFNNSPTPAVICLGDGNSEARIELSDDEVWLLMDVLKSARRDSIADYDVSG